MDCGETFLMPAPGVGGTPHLWIVVTQPHPQTHQCVIVSVTRLRNRKDQTVILRPGDHRFIRCDSTIFYGDCLIVDAQRIEQKIAAGLILVREKCSNATLKLIQDGVAASPVTKRKILRFCQSAWTE